MADLRPETPAPSAPDLQDDLIENSPLREADPLAIEEFLDRINDLLVAGTPSAIRANDDALLTRLVETFREEAKEMVQREKNKPRRAAGAGRPTKPIIPVELLDL